MTTASRPSPTPSRRKFLGAAGAALGSVALPLPGPFADVPHARPEPGRTSDWFPDHVYRWVALELWYDDNVQAAEKAYRALRHVMREGDLPVTRERTRELRRRKKAHGSAEKAYVNRIGRHLAARPEINLGPRPDYRGDLIVTADVFAAVRPGEADRIGFVIDWDPSSGSHRVSLDQITQLVDWTNRIGMPAAPQDLLRRAGEGPDAWRARARKDPVVRRYIRELPPRGAFAR